MPKPNEITVPYDPDKLKAIRKFTAEGDPPIEAELQAAADKLYLKRVPAAVRVFLGDGELLPTPPQKRRKRIDPPANSGGAADESL
ncbi:hypothetical protein LJC34_06070 [Oscillospiraceae bacterium OttesenSCG-928-G22]|nr:hypothetical protein [Oscillospiraceae bacterium OttesenSCG-928-G22]